MEKILKLLEEIARMSVEDIAGITGDPPEAVARKLDEYAKNHVINGYHALVDWEKAGVPRVQAIIELRVSPRRESGFDEIAETIANFEEVDSVMLMSGGYDLALVLNGISCFAPIKRKACSSGWSRWTNGSSGCELRGAYQPARGAYAPVGHP